MRVHRARPEQVEAIVNIEVAAAIGEQLGDPAHFVDVFGNVRLQVQIRMFGPAIARRVRAGRAAAGCEARRHRVVQAPLQVPALNQLELCR